MPKNSATIGEELRGLVERWREEGMPLSTSARHSFTDWAQTVGGILEVANLSGFLKNHKFRGRKDPLRAALGHLGGSEPKRLAFSIRVGKGDC